MDNIEREELEQATFERCPKDKENPYSQISNALIRDESISPECRWLIIYLLSNKPGWKIRIPQIMNHVKAHMGRDKLYKVIDEAIEAGYIQRTEINNGNLRNGVCYRISEEASFKKSFRHPDFQDTEIQDTENTDVSKKTNKIYKKEQEVRIIAQTPTAPRKAVPEVISFSFDSKQFVGITDEDIKAWKELYPAVDVTREIKEMVQWILSHDSKAKSKKLWRKFIFNWLRGSNEKSINKAAYQQSKKESVISRHTGLQQDSSPRNPSRVHDFSDYSQ